MGSTRDVIGETCVVRAERRGLVGLKNACQVERKHKLKTGGLPPAVLEAVRGAVKTESIAKHVDAWLAIQTAPDSPAMRALARHRSQVDGPPASTWEGKPSRTMAQVRKWVAEHIGLAPLLPEDYPCAMAYSMLTAYRDEPKDFFDRHFPRTPTGARNPKDDEGDDADVSDRACDGVSALLAD